jgi:hypothetical protein
LLEEWGEHRMERALEKFAAAGVELTWAINEVFASDPKVAARMERARARGYKVEIDSSPPKRTLIFFGPVSEEEKTGESKQENED